MPPAEIQQEYLTKIKEETGKEMAGLDEKQQYTKQGTYLWDSVKKDFPHNIKTLNRPENKPYLLFVKNTQELEDETINKTADQMRDILRQKNETGLTLSEYLLFQRDYTRRNQTQDKPHPETQYITWLLDSETASSRVLGAVWGSGRSPGQGGFLSFWRSVFRSGLPLLGRSPAALNFGYLASGWFLGFGF